MINKKNIPPTLFVLLVFFAFGTGKAVAQKSTGFRLELFTDVGYSNFLMDANELDPLWKQSGIKAITRGRLFYDLGLAVGYRLNDKTYLKIGCLVQKGAFAHQIRGLLFGSDILHNFNDPQPSTIKSDFQYWKLEFPVQVDYYFTANASWFLSLGLGGAKNLSSKSTRYIEYSDGEIETLEPILYPTREVNLYGLLGIGKRIALTKGKSALLPSLYSKYYFLQEELPIFDATGHLFQSGLRIAYEF